MAFMISALVLGFALAQIGYIEGQSVEKPLIVVKRSDDHAGMLHSHMSRKVFDRACAASKDTIDEIVACMTSNEALLKAVSKEVAANCYKEAFGMSFDPKDMQLHKDIICKNREKFEQMTACIYRKTAEALSKDEMSKLTDAMVDVGLCIVNALDG